MFQKFIKNSQIYIIIFHTYTYIFIYVYENFLNKTINK